MSRRKAHLALGALVLVLVGAFGLFAGPSPVARAAVTSVQVTPTSVENPNTADVTVHAVEIDNVTNGPIVVTASAGALAATTCAVGASPATCTNFAHSGDGGTTVTITAADDGNPADADPVAIGLTFLPPTVTSSTLVTISACQETTAACTPSTSTTTKSATITVNPKPTSRVVVGASPLTLPCATGVSTSVQAVAFDSDGNPIPNASFVFGLDGVNGINGANITQTSPNTAVVTFPSLFVTATITATLLSTGDHDSVTVQSLCNSAHNIDSSNGLALVVTANPNVVQCGGTSIITASARDSEGHNIPGLGFHFTTDQGLLVVGPSNTADNETATAGLQIFPGMTAATVRVTVGTTVGELTKDITVQQYCPAANASPNAIAVTSSATTLNCGQAAFIGASVRDATGLAPADNTEVAFIVSSGKVSPDKIGTVNGSVHTTFTADPTLAGTVLITAASGSRFGSVTLTVNCGAPAGPQIVAPATGTGRILPPNTGSGGLLGKKD